MYNCIHNKNNETRVHLSRIKAATLGLSRVGVRLIIPNFSEASSRRKRFSNIHRVEAVPKKTKLKGDEDKHYTFCDDDNETVAISQFLCFLQQHEIYIRNRKKEQLNISQEQQSSSSEVERRKTTQKIRNERRWTKQKVKQETNSSWYLRLSSVTYSTRSAERSIQAHHQHHPVFVFFFFCISLSVSIVVLGLITHLLGALCWYVRLAKKFSLNHPRHTRALAIFS